MCEKVKREKVGVKREKEEKRKGKWRERGERERRGKKRGWEKKVNEE